MPTQIAAHRVTTGSAVREIWGGPEGVGALLDQLADAVLGDQDAASSVAASRAALLARLTPPGFEADYDNAIDAFFGNHCADAEYPSAFLSWRLIDVYAAAGSRFGPLWWWQYGGCANWPVNGDRYTGPWTARTSTPVRVVGNFFDPATDFAGAEATTQVLRGSRLLAFLVAGTLPPRGTVCPANPNPFVMSAARTTATPARLAGLPTFIPARTDPPRQLHAKVGERHHSSDDEAG